MNISIKFIQRRKPLQDGLCPIVMRITHLRKSKQITLGLKCAYGKFENQEFNTSVPDYRRRNQLLLKYKAKAWQIIDDSMLYGEVFSLEGFEEKFRGRGEKVSIQKFFSILIKEQKSIGKIGNAKVYKGTQNAFMKCFSREICFHELNFNKLNEFELYLRRMNNANGGLSIKFRTLRALYNKAIERGIIDRKFYPFHDFKISRFKSNPIKKALTKEEFLKFKNVDLDLYPNLVQSHKFFLFSFYMRGMNFVDMMNLKKEDIQNGKICYHRQKTGKYFQINILPQAKEILKFYLELERHSKYIFPILLESGVTPLQRSNRKQKVLTKYNQELKQIARLVGITKSISSYTARHTYATLLKLEGVSTDIISESLGHSNIQVTESYLKQFGNEIIDNANNKLIDL